MELIIKVNNNKLKGDFQKIRESFEVYARYIKRKYNIKQCKTDVEVFDQNSDDLLKDRVTVRIKLLEIEYND